MKINQFDQTDIYESLAPMGGYYIWTVHFTDGTADQIEVRDNNLSDKEIADHFGKAVSKVDRDWKVRMRGERGTNDEWHREQDRLEKEKAKTLLPTGQLYEAGMSGINRAAPAYDVSYEDILNDVTDKWKGQTTVVNELSVDKLSAYKDAAASEQSFKKRPLRKLAKSVQGVSTATRKIDTKSTKKREPTAENTYESRLQRFLK